MRILRNTVRLKISIFVFGILAILSTSCVCQTNTVGRYDITSRSWEISGVSSNSVYEVEEIRGYEKRPIGSATFQLTLEKPTLKSLGWYCCLRGQLKYKTGDKRFAAVDWFQGIGFYLSKEHGKQQDWTNGANMAESDFATVILEKDGSFEIRFDVRDTNRNPDSEQEFQIGLVLAKHKNLGKSSINQQVEWSTETPVIKETVRMISVPASPKISKELNLLKQASSWPRDPDGGKLIRAVNGLQRLGKEKALEVLFQFNQAVEQPDSEILWHIVPLLFEHADLRQSPISDSHYRIHFGDGRWISDETRAENRRRWPYDPMVVVDDVPFMMGTHVGGGGLFATPFSAIRWAKRFGVMRSKRLVPTSNPLVAAQKLFSSKKFRDLPIDGFESRVRHIREQAYAMLEIEMQDGHFSEPEQNRFWKRTIKSTYSKATWNTMLQKFVTPVSGEWP